MKPSRFLTRIVVTVVIVAVTALPAFGALGEHADSIAADRKAISAVRSATKVTKDFTVVEVASETVTVREYVSPAGIVFGMAWNGLTNPDLSTLLGSYAGSYEEARRQAPKRRGSRTSQVKTGKVVVETWGHMRNLQGRAYAPELVPQGVNIDEIK